MARVDLAKSRIDREGIICDPALNPPGEDGLEDIAGDYVLLDPIYRAFKCILWTAICKEHSCPDQSFVCSAVFFPEASALT